MFKVLSTIDREKKKNRKKNTKRLLYITVRGLMKKKRNTEREYEKKLGYNKNFHIEEIRKERGKV